MMASVPSPPYSYTLHGALKHHADCLFVQSCPRSNTKVTTEVSQNNRTRTQGLAAYTTVHPQVKS